jgi:hypothetical protein
MVVSSRQAYPTAGPLSWCYDRRVWTAADINIELVDEMSIGVVTTVRIVTSAGDFFVIGNVEGYGRKLVIRSVHIQSGSLRTNSLGWARLRQIARAVAEKADVEAIVIEGGARTTGVGPYGRSPRHLRFARAVHPSRWSSPTKTISAIWALVKRHLELDIAKRKIEEIMVGGIVTVDLPMLEDAAAFQNEMRELGISAVQEKSAAAAQGISG